MNVSTFFTFRKIAPVLIILVLACALFLSLQRFFDHDEFEAVHTAWKMMQGERIYIDFANQHHPFFYYLLMPFLKSFGETTQAILWMRVFMWVMYAAILWLVYLMAREVFGMETALLSALFLGSTLLFLHKAIEIRPDVPQTLFGAAAFLYLVRYFRRNERRHLYLIAILVGISFLFLQKALFPLLFIGAALLYAGYKRRIPYRDVFSYAGVSALAVLPYLIYLIAAGTFSAYLNWAWIMNLKLNVHFPPYKFIMGTLADNAPLWLFYVLGLLFALKTPVEKFFGAASVILLLSVFLVPAPSPQYFMAALPFVAVVSAAGLTEALGGRERMYTATATAMVLLPLIGIAYSMTSAFSGALYNTRQLEKINYVLSLTRPGDVVYDGDIQFNVYRDDLDFIWFSVSPKEGQLSTYQKWKGYRYDILELIDKKKPKVISDYTIKKMLADPRIANHYAPSERYSDLYIRRD